MRKLLPVSLVVKNSTRVIRFFDDGISSWRSLRASQIIGSHSNLRTFFSSTQHFCISKGDLGVTDRKCDELQASSACERTVAIPHEQNTVPYRTVPSNPLVFLDIAVEGDLQGRVFIELFRDIVPKTAEHFRSLCTGERGGFRHRSTPSSEHLGLKSTGWSYQGVPFHRVVSGFIVQGGDISTRDGRSNKSLFGYSFPPEIEMGLSRKNLRGGEKNEEFGRVIREGKNSLLVPCVNKAHSHVARTVALAHINGDPHRCGSQFFFNLVRNKHLDGNFLVIGQVVEGWDVVESVGRSCGSRSGIPVSRSWVLSCGQSGGYLEEETEAALQGERETRVSKAYPPTLR